MVSTSPPQTLVDETPNLTEPKIEIQSISLPKIEVNQGQKVSAFSLAPDGSGLHR